MDTQEWLCPLKTARQKKRLVKADRDKKLMRLEKRRLDLWQQRRLLPPTPLKHPYQRGWKRFFVLREDLKYDAKALFYEALLAKINTVEYHYDKAFKQRKRRRKRYQYTSRLQLLQEISAYSWDSNHLELTEEEKACFSCVETYHVETRCRVIKYVFSEPWRYRLKIAPHMITHVRTLDIDIERELAYIEDHIANHNLGPRINTLAHGAGYSWKRWAGERSKHINKIKNIPRYSSKETYLVLDI
ncbi:hypothetical protein [Sphingobacterium yanglingense]|uniref:Uncharacterized protein n=1 Tax=Sphingobacterium yanglingense TaxID=1437280 RepID=A0A4V6PXE3_9SPHI|nr:hypothetical protein [Sphingobacterium yanglingense]TDQ76944.1 hypothetical protein CLV99_2332 [Sphingobacterium yanglingense]